MQLQNLFYSSLAVAGKCDMALLDIWIMMGSEMVLIFMQYNSLPVLTHQFFKSRTNFSIKFQFIKGGRATTMASWSSR